MGHSEACHFPVFRVSLEGGDAHVENQLARISCLLACRVVRAVRELRLGTSRLRFGPGSSRLFQTMTRQTRTHLFVASVTAAALGLVAVAPDRSFPFPGWWAFGKLCGRGFRPGDSQHTITSRSEGLHRPSSCISAAGLLFGAFWSGLITGFSTILGEIASATSQSS